MDGLDKKIGQMEGHNRDKRRERTGQTEDTLRL